MRSINRIIVHCSATPNGRPTSVSDINQWHRDRGWNEIGYHYVIGVNGVGERGRDRSLVGAHCKGYNTGSLGVCLIGTDSFNEKQMDTLRGMIRRFRLEYPDCTIHGHREFNDNKTCPGFDVQKWVKQIEEKKPMNIFQSMFGYFGEVFSGVTGEVIENVKGISIDAVNNAENLIGAEGWEKRDAAFNEITDKAAKAGIAVSTHAINTAIELAVARLRG